MRTRSSALLIAALCLVTPALIFALTLTGSRSAIILGGVAAAATLGFLLTPELAKLGRRRSLALVAAFALALLPVAMGLGLLEILSRFAVQDVAEDARWRIAGNVWAGIRGYFPVGAGVGAGSSAAMLPMGVFISSAAAAALRFSASMRATKSLVRSWSVRSIVVRPASGKTDSPLGPARASILVRAVSSQKGPWSRSKLAVSFNVRPAESFQE